jgi:hypothetical protein
MGQQVTNWRKSSASQNGEACVELGGMPGAVLLRDTMDRDGVMLEIPASAWTEFLTTLR